MTDMQLRLPVKTAIPNTYAESNLLQQNKHTDLTFQKERKEQMAKGLDRSHNLLKYKKNHQKFEQSY